MKDKKLETEILSLLSEAEEKQIDLSHAVAALREQINTSAPETQVWNRVLTARNIARPSAGAYIDLIADEHLELHGDRYYGDDPAMIGGLMTIDGIPFTYIGNQKGHDMKSNIDCNYGMSNPEGYRKARRLAEEAERYHRTVVTFIDTSGAYPGAGAEARGIGEAIAQNLKVFSRLKTPILCFVIGEGGSGGAIGIGVGDRIYMLENAVYSVISPEGFASILLRDASKAKEAASLMKMTSDELAKTGILTAVIPEVPGGAHLNPEFTAVKIKKILLESHAELTKRPIERLLSSREAKIQRISRFADRF